MAIAMVLMSLVNTPRGCHYLPVGHAMERYDYVTLAEPCFEFVQPTVWIMFQVRLWSLPERKCISSFQAHEGFVRGLSFTPDGDRFMTIGDDKTIKTWEVEGDHEEPINTILSKVQMLNIVSILSFSKT